MRILRRSLRKLAWLALLFVCAGLGLGARGKAASLPGGSGSAASLMSRFTIADFDGDNRPDVATVEIGQVGASHARYWIGFQMSAGEHQSIGLTAPIGGLEIASRDVNGDHRLDLIVTTTWFKNPVVVLLNDGHGNFTVTDPAVFSAGSLTPEEIWTLPSLDAKDCALAVLARASGDCALGDTVAERWTQPEVATVTTSHHHVFALAVSVLGRAPPPFVIHG